jgi:outer membrane protein OmpA-like peptidoglycan-associated protein/flagellar hook assembly protein FlgD
MEKILNLCSLLIFLSVGILGAYEPPAGGEEIHDITSVSELSSGASVTDAENVEAGVFNPAAGGTRELFSIGFGYIGLIGSNGVDTGWFGHTGGFNLIIPTVFGNFMGGISFYYAPVTGMDIGTYAAVHAGYAREIFDNFFLGGNALVKIGSKDVTTFGIAADLGFLHTPGDLSFLKTFAWGIALKEFGFWFDLDTDAVGDNRSPSPPPFTPVVGAAFNVFELPEFGLRFNTDLSFPTFSNFKVGFGLKGYITNIVTVKTGFRIDISQLVNGNIAQRSFVPSFGFQINLSDLIDQKSKRPGSRQEGMKTEIAAAPFMNGTWGLGIGGEISIGKTDEVPPEISVTYPEPIYFSPNNDGRQDYFEIPISIRDPSYVESFSVNIYDSSGNLVKEIRNKDERPENKSLSGVVGRIGTADTGITVPESVQWDGIMDNGAPATDGVYTFEVVSTDLKGNKGVSGQHKMHLDTTPPQAEITLPDANEIMFSPNSDGNKDTFSITQSGTEEKEWTGIIFDSEANKVKQYSFSGSTPEQIIWDGTNEKGESVEDGIYRYVLMGEDEAGNTVKESLDNIIVNTDETAVFITAGGDAFSPNGDGLFDALSIQPLIMNIEGIKAWRIDIVHSSKGTVFSYEGEETSPEKVDWPGTAEDGSIIEGEYHAHIQVVYKNGNEPEATTRPFLLDVTPPEVNADISPQPFSPDNDGMDDELYIDLDIKELAGIDSWELIISDPRGARFDTISGMGEPRDTLIWNGYSSTGELVQSAEDYPYTFEIADIVGNVAQYQGNIPVDVLVIREDGKLKIRISNITFAPNSPELVSEDIKKAEKNIKILGRIAELLKKYGSYSVRIEGHAVRVHWNDEERGEREEIEELLPLSTARAETVKEALIELGINPARLSTVGLGGRQPIVPHSDLENRWKNRRVEFILLK